MFREKLYSLLTVLSKNNLFSYRGVVAFIVAAFLSLSCFIPFAVAVEDGCHNKTTWAESRQSKFFTVDAIIPNKWPLTTFDTKKSMDTFYPNGFGAQTSEALNCARYSCTRTPGKVGFFTAANKANPQVCRCTTRASELCNDMYVFVVGSDPIVKSGPKGSRMPDFPPPTYPAEWDQKFYYKGTYTGAVSDIPSYLLGRVPTELKDSTTTVTKCTGIDIVGSGDKIGEIRKHVINNVKTVRQHLEQFYTAWSWTQDFGVCGNKVWSWREGRHMIATQERITHKIPVEVLRAKWIETNTPANVIRGCPQGTEDPNRPGTCVHQISANNAADCPNGYTFVYGAFGSSVCRRDNITMGRSCTSGFLTEDTSTTPSTWTCIGGSFSNPDPQPVNICGARGKAAVPKPGDYDGTFTLEKKLDRTGEVTGETTPTTPPVVPVIPPTPPTTPPTTPEPTGKTLTNEAKWAEGRQTGKGFTGNCVTVNTDVQYSRTAYGGFYPRGWIGNDCMGPTCLLRIVKCEFDKTKFGSFLASFDLISGQKRLPRFEIDLGSFGSGFAVDFNDSEYRAGFDLIRQVFLLVCFVSGLRILMG